MIVTIEIEIKGRKLHRKYYLDPEGELPDDMQGRLQDMVDTVLDEDTMG